MTSVDVVGWLAATLTLLTFGCVDMRRLRAMALCANMAFIVYGAAAALWPVLALHVALAPLNAWRLRQARASARLSSSAPARLARRGPSRTRLRAARTRAGHRLAAYSCQRAVLPRRRRKPAP
jgi:hypothetical protein